MPRQRCGSSFVNILNRSDALEDRLSVKNLQTGNAGGAAEWIRSVRMPMEKCAAAICAAKRLLNSRRANRRAHRQKTASQSFRQAHNIRDDAGQFTCEHLAAAPKAGENL